MENSGLWICKKALQHIDYANNGFLFVELIAYMEIGARNEDFQVSKPICGQSANKRRSIQKPSLANTLDKIAKGGKEATTR